MFCQKHHLCKSCHIGVRTSKDGRKCQAQACLPIFVIVTLFPISFKPPISYHLLT